MRRVALTRETTLFLQETAAHASFPLPSLTSTWPPQFWESALGVQLTLKVHCSPSLSPNPSFYLYHPPALPVRTASKRRVIAPQPKRETAPVPVRRTRSTVKRKEAEQAPDQENGDLKKKVVDKVPSRHTLPDEKGACSETINSHFRTSKRREGKGENPEVRSDNMDMANSM